MIIVFIWIISQYKDHMLISRQNFTATLLKDNTVLIVGGRHKNNQTDLVEVYNPQTHFSHFVGRLNIPRENHRAILLNNGRVLIVGGTNYDNSGYNFILQAEIYNPQTHKFYLTDKLKVDGIEDLTLSKLHDGRILVAGGSGIYGGTRKTNEIYDIKSNKFKLVANSILVHMEHTANVLPNGNVLIAGGGYEPKTNAQLFKQTEIYKPKVNKFIQGPNMLEPRRQFKSITLNNGKVLLIGGGGCSDVKCLNTEIYNPVTNQFSYAGKLLKARFSELNPILLNNGSLYIVGSDAYPAPFIYGTKIVPKKSTCEVYNPNSNISRFTNICINPATRGHLLILLPEGKLLLFGGLYGHAPDELCRKIEIINTKEIK